MTLLLFDSASQNGGQPHWDTYNPFDDNDTIATLRCYQLERDKNNSLVKVLGSDEDDTVYVGFRLYTGYEQDGGDYLVQFRGDGGSVNHVSIAMNGADGSISAYRGNTGTTSLGTTGTPKYPNNGWFYVEVRMTCHDTAGIIEIKFDGTSVLNLTSQDTRNGGADALIDEIAWGASETQSGTYIRDIVIMNEAGGTFNTFLGPISIQTYRADGAGNYTNWTPDTGSNYQRIDETDFDSDTSYVSSTSTGIRDSYTFTNVPSGLGAPIAVQGRYVGRYVTAPIDIGMFLRRSATDDDAALATPSASYSHLGNKIWETDPIAASAWTSANFNATEFGVRTSTAP